MLGSLGPMEIGIIVLIVVLIFGPRQLPKMGKALGETIKEFRGIRRELNDTKDDVDETVRRVKQEVR